MYAIETHGLTKYYGKTRGIENLCLTVDEGEFFGFIGPNGAGKSTAIRTLLGLISPTGGTAQVLGRDIVKERETVCRFVGYLPSESAFYSGMKVREVLKLSAGLRKMDCREEAGLLCERLQLDKNKRVEDLSLGNRKKVSIVCALQHDPKLLLLDEPTSGLDPLMQKEFFELLHQRNRAGVTVFLSSHVLSEIRRHCTRAAVIRDGQIIALDSVSAMNKTNAKRVCVRGEADLSGLSGVRDLNASQDGVSFLYSGSTDALLKTLSLGKIEDLTVTEPDAEEIFLHYYRKEEAENDGFSA